jgi:hypothetical protein
VEVPATAGVITADTQIVQSSLDSNTLLARPGNVRGGNGSIGPYALVATLRSVQPDDAGQVSARFEF